jgi:hypothetical protein
MCFVNDAPILAILPLRAAYLESGRRARAAAPRSKT